MKRNALITMLSSLIVIVFLVAVVMLIDMVNKIYDSDENTLVISSASATAYYTGQPLEDERWEILSGDLQDGHEISVKVSGSQTNVGTSLNKLVAVVTDINGTDVTSQYKIEYKPGALNVKARRLYVTANSAMKPYDGTPLADPTYTLENPSLLAVGATLDVVVEGSTTEPGIVDNKIVSVKVFDKNGEDITKNYSFRKRSGKLQVYSPDAIIIKSGSAHKEEDGSPLTCDSWEPISVNLQPGHQLVVATTGKCTSVGSVKNSFVVTIWDSEKNDVTSSYEIVKILGDLIVLAPSDSSGRE